MTHLERAAIRAVELDKVNDREAKADAEMIRGLVALYESARRDGRDMARKVDEERTAAHRELGWCREAHARLSEARRWSAFWASGFAFLAGLLARSYL